MIVKSFKTITKKIAFISLIAIATLHCGDPVPVEEMGNAKLAIAKAESVMADKYSKDKYLGARKALLDSHQQVSEDEMEEAKKKAIESEKLANEAFAISAPKLAKDTKKEANKSTALADEAYAEEFASDDFQNAKSTMEEGDQLYNEKKYVEAFKKYEESRESAKKARNISEAQAETMKNDITEVESTITEAEKYGASDDNENLANAKQKIASAKSNVDALKLKVAHAQIREAKDSAAKAKDTALEKWAKDKYSEAQLLVKEADDNLKALNEKIDNEETKKALERSPEAKDSIQSTADTLTAAKDALNASKRALDDKTYHDSHTQSEEAIRLASIVNNQIPQNMVLVTQAVADYNAYLVEQAKNAADKKRLEELAKKKNIDWEAKLAQLRKGWKKYKVRYIPKNRDCLWKIAAYRKHYGKARLWPRIYKANKHQIRNPDLIYPNQVFDIPPKRGSVVKETIESLKKKYKEENGEDSINEGTTTETKNENNNSDDTIDKELDSDDTINDDTIDANE